MFISFFLLLREELPSLLLRLCSLIIFIFYIVRISFDDELLVEAVPFSY
jgi:hypothetical protein